MAPFDAAPSSYLAPAAAVAIHGAPRAPRLSDFGLDAPLTDRQAALILKLFKHSAIGWRFGYVASPVDTPVLQSLNRLGLALYDREPRGSTGPRARTLTVWWLTPPASGLAIALKRGELLTAETAALRAANDRRPS